MHENINQDKDIRDMPQSLYTATALHAGVVVVAKSALKVTVTKNAAR
ncbi:MULTISPECIES: hypothetical protein [Streptomyces]|uniref:Uncharacterized protein n=1 Tax=Streptomyces ramulosus TaxID=47762 RepID=A0ABW1FSW0_9ACTN